MIEGYNRLKFLSHSLCAVYSMKNIKLFLTEQAYSWNGTGKSFSQTALFPHLKRRLNDLTQIMSDQR
jgi:hypothetical protein